MKDGFDAILERYGSPHLWEPWHWWINFWRLLGEHIEIRIILDVATRCPDKKLRAQAVAKLRNEIEVKRLDTSWPGKGSFTYDWKGITRARLIREKATAKESS